MRLPALISIPFWLAGLPALSAGCQTETPTQVIVVLRADPGVREASQTLMVTVTSQDGSVVLEREKTIDASVAQLARVPLIPKKEDASRWFSLQAELRDAMGAPVSRVEAQAGYTENELRHLELWFRDTCLNVLCDPGSTCQSGACVGSCFDPGTESAPATLARCSECERCAGVSCESVPDDTSCGCPGDSCQSGACVPIQPVSFVSAGFNHTCAETEVAVYCWGNNAVAQVGNGESETVVATPFPTIVGGRRTVTPGRFHTCALDFDGSRECWGRNGSGEFGSGSRGPASTPEFISAEPALVLLDSGWTHLCGIDQNNAMWCWGENEHGSSGNGAFNADGEDTPQRVGVETDWTRVSAGGLHSCGIRAEGELWCWGFNDSGELGVGDFGNRNVPVRADCSGLEGTQCSDDWTAISSGSFHTCGLREGGRLFCWGGSINGQLGIGPSQQAENRPRAVAGTWLSVEAGRSFTCATAPDGRLWCWGSNAVGELGLGDTEKRTSPTRVDLDPRGGFKSYALGDGHSCAVAGDSTLWCWGRNDQGQVGLGTLTPFETSPQRVCMPPVN